MKKYNFDTLTDRRKFATMKWDLPDGALPMWVADMDFECAPKIREAIEARAAHGIFGYSDTPREYFAAVSSFFERISGYRHDPEDMIFSTGVVAIISSCVRKLTTPAEKVLIQAPVYNIFYNSILNNGRVVLSSDLIYENGEYHWFEGKRIDNPNTHGTGCTLSSAIASNLAKGFALAESVQRAKEYISSALSAQLDLGQGSGPMMHNFDLTSHFAEEKISD